MARWQLEGVREIADVANHSEPPSTRRNGQSQRKRTTKHLDLGTAPSPPGAAEVSIGSHIRKRNRETEP